MGVSHSAGGEVSGERVTVPPPAPARPRRGALVCAGCGARVQVLALTTLLCAACEAERIEAAGVTAQVRARGEGANDEQNTNPIDPEAR